MPRRRSLGFAALVAITSLPLLSAPAAAATFNNTLYFSTFTSQGGTFAHSVNYTYNDATKNFSLGTVANLKPGPAGADGLIFTPDGKSLLWGGQANAAIYETDLTGKVIGTFSTGGQGVYHLALSPDGKTVYGGGEEGGYNGLAVVPTNPLANGISHPLTGSDTGITGIGFDKNGNAFYTHASDGGGNGDFGTLNLTTFKTTAILTALPAAHGIIFDPYTNDFFLVGDSQITQIDPSNPSVPIATITVAGAVNFDQGAADGMGHLLVGANNGILAFIDYAATGNIGTASFVTTQFLDTDLDDVAPLSGLGSPNAPAAATVPEPSSLALLGLGAAALAGWRRYRRKAAA